MSKTPNTATVEPKEERPGRRISLTWLVPLFALLIALGVTWQVYSERGPLLEVSLRHGAGISAGQTGLRYRDVEIGVVEEVRFSDDLSEVVTQIRIDKAIAPFLDGDAKIWAVRPQVTAGGVSGLDTVISGVYLSASFDSEPDGMVSRILAERSAPLTPTGVPGRRIRLSATDGGSINVGAPVLYKGVEVGRVETKALSEDGTAVVFDAFIDAPHDQRITSGTLFWNASGLALELGPGGAELNVESLASLVRGGIAFDTLGLTVDTVEPGTLFRLYPSEEAAQNSLLDVDLAAAVEFSAVFSGTLRGLSVGSAVEYRGVRVGEVIGLSTRLNLTVTPRRPELLTTLLIQPRRFGLGADTEPEDMVAFLNELVVGGLRARLTSAGLLSGSMVVDLHETGERGRAVLANDGLRPRIPSIASSTDGFAASAEGVLRRVDDLPIEELMAGTVTLIDSLNRVVNDPAVRDAPASASALIEDLRTLVARDEVQRAPEELLAVISDLGTIVDTISDTDPGGSIGDVSAQATALLTSLTRSAEAVGPVLETASAALQDLRGLPLTQVTDEATEVLNGVDDLIASLQRIAQDPDLLATPGTARSFVRDLQTFIRSDGVQGAPEALRATLDETTAVLAALQEGGAIENLNATLRDTSRAADAAARASEGVPGLVEDLNALTEQLAALPLDPLFARANGVLSQAEGILEEPAIREAPGALRDAFAAMTEVLTDVRERGLVDELNTTLAATSAAATSFASASSDLPRLLSDVRALADQAETTLAAYDEGGTLSYEAQTALRDIRDTA
ncbi:MAG: MlaD family protein, partial [Pseudomonadota bacterium]